MDIMHSSLLWIVIAAAPAVTAFGILVRLARGSSRLDLSVDASGGPKQRKSVNRSTSKA